MPFLYVHMLINTVTCLTLIIGVGSMALAQLRGDKNLMAQAHTRYGQSISLIKGRLRSADAAVQEDMVSSAMLLGFFEA